MTSSSPAVVVLGSLHYDITVQGPARPRKGETVTGQSWQPKCGGKGGNQAVAAAKAGVQTVRFRSVRVPQEIYACALMRTGRCPRTTQILTCLDSRLRGKAGVPNE